MIFGEISIEDKPLFHRLLSENPYVDCEYLFSTLFMWQDVLGYQCAIEGDCIFVRHLVDGKMLYHMPICKPENLASNVKRLMEQEQGALELFCVTEEHLSQLPPELIEQFTLEEKRDYADYLYTGEALRTLGGKKLHQKRNHVSKFQKTYNWDFKVFTEAGELLNTCMEILQQWDTQKLENASWHERLLVGNELKALDRCVKNFNQMGLIGGVLFVDGKPKGFTIGEKAVRGDISVGIVHYEKGDSEIAGIYQAINKFFAEQALSDVDFINRQDDMGVEGLRKAKLSYYPVRLVSKSIMKQISV